MPFMPGSSSNTLEVQVQSSGVGGFRNRMDNAVDTLFKFRTAVGIAGGALAAFATGALAKATSAAADFEEAIVEVQKVTDEATAAALAPQIRKMAERIPLAQEKLAALTADAARFGVRGTDNILAFTESTAKMATATNLNTEEAGEALAKLSELTDTPISEIENLGSAINTLSNNFATSSQEVVDSMLRSSAALSQFGLNQRQIAGIGAALNEVSASARRAGTRLRRVAQELMDPDKAAKVADAIGMSSDEFQRMRKEEPQKLFIKLAETMREDGEAANKLRQTFSTVSRQALAGLGQNLEGTREALQTSNEAFEEGSSLQREFDAATDTFNAKLQLLKNRLGNVAIEIGNVLLPHATRFLEVVNNLLDSEDSLINRLTAKQKALGLVGTAIVGLAMAIGAFVSGPLALAILGVSAFAAAWQADFMNIRRITRMTIQRVSAILNKIKSIVLPVVRQNLATLQRLWDKHGAGIVAQVRWALNTALSVIRSVLQFIIKNWTLPLLRRLTSIWQRHFSDIAKEVIETFNVVMSDARQFAIAFNQFWNRWGDEIMTVARFAMDALIGIVGTAFDLILTTIRIVLALIRGDWKDVWDLASDFFERTFDGLVSFIEKWGGGFLDVLVSAAKDAINAFLKPIRNAVDEAKELINSIPAVNIGGNGGNGGGGIPGIPGLAHGGIVTEPTLAAIGEKGPEAVIPLSKLDQMKQPLIGGNVVIHASSREGGRQAAEAFTDELRSHGMRSR